MSKKNLLPKGLTIYEIIKKSKLIFIGVFFLCSIIGCQTEEESINDGLDPQNIEIGDIEVDKEQQARSSSSYTIICAPQPVPQVLNLWITYQIM